MPPGLAIKIHSILPQVFLPVFARRMVENKWEKDKSPGSYKSNIHGTGSTTKDKNIPDAPGFYLICSQLQFVWGRGQVCLMGIICEPNISLIPLSTKHPKKLDHRLKDL